MRFLFNAEVEPDFDFDHMKLYESSVRAVLEAEKCPLDIVVTLILTDDESIRFINRENRGIDKATDVLSFPMLDFTSPSDFTVAAEDVLAKDPDTGETNMGDIIISKDRMTEQASQYGHDIQREFAFLIVHSMLHLCGYDHIEEEDRKLMEERQKIIMDKLIVDFPKLAV